MPPETQQNTAQLCRRSSPQILILAEWVIMVQLDRGVPACRPQLGENHVFERFAWPPHFFSPNLTTQLQKLKKIQVSKDITILHLFRNGICTSSLDFRSDLHDVTPLSMTTPLLSTRSGSYVAPCGAYSALWCLSPVKTVLSEF